LSGPEDETNIEEADEREAIEYSQKSMKLNSVEIAETYMVGKAEFCTSSMGYRLNL
jgi:hypothetical protein